MRAETVYQRGDVVLVELEAMTGSEQSRKRPCIVLSEAETIRASGAQALYFVVPLTTAGKLSGPLAPQLKHRPGGLPADSTALVMHAHSIEPRRVVSRWGSVDSQDIDALQAAIRVLIAG